MSLNISSSANLRMAVISAGLRNPLHNSIRGSSLNTNVRVPPLPPELLDQQVQYHMKNNMVRSAITGVSTTLCWGWGPNRMNAGRSTKVWIEIWTLCLNPTADQRIMIKWYKGVNTYFLFPKKTQSNVSFINSNRVLTASLHSTVERLQILFHYSHCVPAQSPGHPLAWSWRAVVLSRDIFRFQLFDLGCVYHDGGFNSPKNTPFTWWMKACSSQKVWNNFNGCFWFP